MSDVDFRQFFQSAKAENDRRARLGLPLDGDFESSNRIEDPCAAPDGGGVRASLVGTLLIGISYLAFHAVVGALTRAFRTMPSH